MSFKFNLNEARKDKITSKELNDFLVGLSDAVENNNIDNYKFVPFFPEINKANEFNFENIDKNNFENQELKFDFVNVESNYVPDSDYSDKVNLNKIMNKFTGLAA